MHQRAWLTSYVSLRRVEVIARVAGERKETGDARPVPISVPVPLHVEIRGSRWLREVFSCIRGTWDHIRDRMLSGPRVIGDLIKEEGKRWRKKHASRFLYCLKPQVGSVRLSRWIMIDPGSRAIRKTVCFNSNHRSGRLSCRSSQLFKSRATLRTASSSLSFYFFSFKTVIRDSDPCHGQVSIARRMF